MKRGRRGGAALTALVTSKGPIWSAEQTYLWRFIEHKINFWDINLENSTDSNSGGV